MTDHRRRRRPTTRTVLGIPLLVGMLLPAIATAQSADALYYRIGGASPFSVSAGRGYDPNARGIGLRWNLNATCGNFDIGATVSNQLNGDTDGFQNLIPGAHRFRPGHALLSSDV